MMSVEDCVVSWIQNCLDGKNKCVYSGSCHGYDFKFYSYSTPIAKFYPGTKQFVINPRHYSTTMTRQQNLLRKHLHGLNVHESEGLR